MGDFPDARPSNLFRGASEGTLGRFSIITRTSLKTQLLFMFSEHSNFQAFFFPESCLQTDKIPKNSMYVAFLLFVNVLIFYFASLLDVLFFAVRPSKIHFSGCQLKNRTYCKSLETRKSLEVDFIL